jgi:hypothetical protein
MGDLYKNALAMATYYEKKAAEVPGAVATVDAPFTMDIERA